MEKRLLLALVLAVCVISVTPLLFPNAGRQPDSSLKDSTSSQPTPDSVSQADSGMSVPAPVTVDTGVGRLPGAPPPVAETVTVKSERTVHRFSTLGAALLDVQMLSFRNLARRSETVRLGFASSPLLRFSVITPADTIRLASVAFRRVAESAGDSVVTFETNFRDKRIVLRYDLGRDGYTARVSGKITNASGTGEEGLLVIDLPPAFFPAEADTVEEAQHLAYAFKPALGNTRSIRFNGLDSGEREIVDSLIWIAAKNKYFVVGLLTPVGERPFDQVIVTGQHQVSKSSVRGAGSVVTRLRDGSFSFDMYTGPQEWKRLISMKREFDHVNPYGWSFLQGIIHPLATIVIRVLLWMHNALHLSYGWVLIIFGVLVRLILWPLNQGAMRSSLKMQELQPRLAEVQKKYQNNPEKQREEIMRIYQETGTSPFTAFSGCLPMLIPMPVLFALFFVFQNTIEFRGVSFLWLPDISTKDPYYIVPVAMGVSMYLLTWIGSRNAPANPQGKLVGYMLPVMMTFLLANLASGLNLYYTIQNIAALPQQWLIARERQKGMQAKTSGQGTKKIVSAKS
jgi:YidC/Oxa1 family membrane protein insertase